MPLRTKTMYPLPYDDTIGCSILVLELSRILEATPGLLSWGSMLSLPKSEIIRIVIHVTDIAISSGLNNTNIHYISDAPQIIDSIKDSICFIYDEHPTIPPRPLDDPEYVAMMSQFEEEVIDAGLHLRSIMWSSITYCRLLKICGRSESAYIEIDYVTEFL